MHTASLLYLPLRKTFSFPRIPVKIVLKSKKNNGLTFMFRKMGGDIDGEARMLLALINQKCMVFQNRMTPFDFQSDANCYYKKFSIGNPDYFDRTEHGWKPENGEEK